MSLKNADKFGIIDIGSNTIRGVLYGGGENPSALDTVTFQSNILADTNEGVLSAEGIFNLCGSLSKIKNEFKDCIRIYAFATSAMRDVNNFDAVYDKVREETGIEIDLISGEREAEYDFLALKSISGGKCGTGVDLGGGSAQIICFDKEGVKESCSLPIGVKRVRNMFCRDFLPKKSEIEKIEEYIKTKLCEIKSKNKNIWFMGGTAKAALNASKKVLNEDKLTPKIIDTLYEITSANPPLLEKLFKMRYKTMPVGFIVMKSICENLGGENITVTEAGVRDGYLESLYEHHTITEG